MYRDRLKISCEEQFCMQCGLPAQRCFENMGGYPAFFCFRHDLETLTKKTRTSRGRYSGNSQTPYGGYELR